MNEDSLRTSVDEKMTASDANRWFDVENDDDVRDAIVSDFANETEKFAAERIYDRFG